MSVLWLADGLQISSAMSKANLLICIECTLSIGYKGRGANDAALVISISVEPEQAAARTWQQNGYTCSLIVFRLKRLVSWTSGPAADSSQSPRLPVMQATMPTPSSKPCHAVVISTSCRHPAWHVALHVCGLRVDWKPNPSHATFLQTLRQASDWQVIYTMVTTFRSNINVHHWRSCASHA